MNVILTAGLGTRMGDLAPDGCKSLTMVDGRPAIEWQLGVLGEATIVCRGRHKHILEQYGPVIVDDSLCGPVFALNAALPADGPITVVYADSLFTALPHGDEWCGVAEASGPRSWDVVDYDEEAMMPMVRHRWVSREETARVCTGIYRFGELRKISELSMPEMLNRRRTPMVEISSWRDVGTPEALAAVS